jgi:hypothetical protein
VRLINFKSGLDAAFENLAEITKRLLSDPEKLKEWKKMTGERILESINAICIYVPKTVQPTTAYLKLKVNLRFESAP